jgi:hypothetical protein
MLSTPWSGGLIIQNLQQPRRDQIGAMPVDMAIVKV